MKKISIQKNGIITNQVEMENEQADAWLSEHIAMGTFGNADVYANQPILITPDVYEDQQILVEDAVTIEQEILDEEENSFDPPQFETVIITPAVYETQSILISPAVYEMESYVITEQVLDLDGMTIIVEEVLGTRQVLVPVLITPAEYTVIEEDTTDAVANELLKTTKIAEGKAARQVCENVLDLIAGFNLERELTSQQITQMQAMFSNPELALRSSRPSTAKALISAITPDGVLVTQQMKDLCVSLLSNY